MLVFIEEHSEVCHFVFVNDDGVGARQRKLTSCCVVVFTRVATDIVVVRTRLLMAGLSSSA